MTHMHQITQQTHLIITLLEVTAIRLMLSMNKATKSISLGEALISIILLKQGKTHIVTKRISDLIPKVLEKLNLIFTN